MNITEVFLAILKTSLWDQPCSDLPQLREDQWVELYQISEKHSVAPMIYQQVFGCEGFHTASSQLQQVWKSSTLAKAGDQTRRSFLFLMLYEKMRQSGLHPLIVKGIVCRELYVQPDLRISNDEDLLIPREEFPAMDEFLLKEGFLRSELDCEKEYQEVGYHNPGTGLYLEIHMDLFAQESGAYGHLNRLFTSVFDTCDNMKIQGTDILTLNPQEHLLYLICHSLKHFLHSGFGIRQLCDILLFARTCKDQLSWKDLSKTLKEYHMYDFTMNLLDIGIVYLGFQWEDLGLKEPKNVSLDCVALLNDMMDGGIFGKNDANRVHSANITLNAAENKSSNAVTGIMSSLFPGKEYICNHYPYARKHHFLIPVAYMDRIFHYLCHNRKHSSSEEKNSIQVGMERMKLLEKYKILE